MLNTHEAERIQTNGRRPVRKAAAVSLLAVTLLLVAVVPSDAWHAGRHRHPGVRTRVFVGFGPSFWWGPPYPYWYYPPPYYVYSPPPVVVEEPPVYIQQPPASAPSSFWYYCSSAKAYYPTVPTCPEAWIRVPQRTE
jgi:hypothetical protein